MDRVHPEPLGFGCPLLADEFVGRQTFEGLEPAAEVVGIDEVGEVLPQLRAIVVAHRPAARTRPGGGLSSGYEMVGLQAGLTLVNFVTQYRGAILVFRHGDIHHPRTARTLG